eukprot:2764125-Rhodomonas_salina.2
MYRTEMSEHDAPLRCEIKDAKPRSRYQSAGGQPCSAAGAQSPHAGALRCPAKSMAFLAQTALSFFNLGLFALRFRGLRARALLS